jgi:hypothetical protein
MHLLEQVCAFLRERIQRVDFVTHCLIVILLNLTSSLSRFDDVTLRGRSWADAVTRVNETDTSITSDCNDDESHPRSGSFGGDSLDSGWSLDSTNEKAISNLSSYQRAGVNVSAYSKIIPSMGLKEARLGTGRSAVTRGG